MTDGLVLFAHGSPTSTGLDAVRAIADAVRGSLVGVPVAIGWLGHAEPDVAGAVRELADRGCTRVVVVPLLLTPGAHSTRDVPAAVSAVTARVTISVAEPIGGHEGLVDAVLDRAGPGSPETTLVMVAGGGSPVADAEAARVAHLAGALGGFARGLVAFAGSSPGVATVLSQITGDAVVVPYLLGPGVLLDRVQAATPTTDPLGTHPGVLRAILERLATAPAGVPTGGWVALVGGGPGAPGLLTLRGAELLRAADVVVVDRLAPDLPGLIGDAQVIGVGKGPGHGATQEDINALLVHHASLGLGVVRLKGGDPFVFGRGGEEALACAAAGLAVEVVPGVTSAIAAPAAAGIPVTHRGVSAAVTVLSAHLAPGAEGDPHDWQALADLHGTLVVLMGVATLTALTRELMARGMDPDTPAALVHSAWLPQQEVARATLGTIRDAGLANPAVLVIGDVAGTLGG